MTNVDSVILSPRAHRVILTGNHIVLNLVGIFKGAKGICAYVLFTFYWPTLGMPWNIFETLEIRCLIIFVQVRI